MIFFVAPLLSHAQVIAWSKPIRITTISLEGNATVTARPSQEEENDLFSLVLRYPQGGRTVEVRKQLHCNSAKPQDFRFARYRHTNKWLLLFTEGSMKTTCTSCYEVDMSQHVIRTLFVDNVGTDLPSKRQLARGVFYESEHAKWISGKVSPLHSHDVWARTGRFIPQQNAIRFSRWRTIRWDD